MTTWRSAAFFVVTAVAAAYPARADNEVMIRGCSMLSDAERIQCLEAVARGGAPDQSAGIVRSFTALRAAVTTGISYVNYTPLVQSAATEVALLRDRAASDREREAAGYFGKAIDAYSDAATFWQADISFYARRGNAEAYAGGLPFNLAGVGHLVSKWGLPTEKSDIWGIQRGVPRSTALRILWGKADDYYRFGSELLKQPQ